MGYDENDAAYDDYLNDWKTDHDTLLEAFGLFWASHARLVQAAGMVITEFLGIAPSRQEQFAASFLDDLSLHRAAAILKRAIAQTSADSYASLPKSLRAIADFRNRLAHDALIFPTAPSDGWPEIVRRGRSTEARHTPEELAARVQECSRLEEELLGLLALVRPLDR